MEKQHICSVSIFGAGIAGLSAAHELALAGYKVTVYEKEDIAGGMAKSRRDSTSGLPTEYSWRGYGQFYQNTYHLMKQIPVSVEKYQQKVDSRKKSIHTVYSSELSRPIKFVLVKDDVEDVNDAEHWDNSFSTTDWATIFLQMCREMSSDLREQDYAKINAFDYLKKRVSPRSLIYMASVFGPWLGIDPKRTSIHHLANFFRMIQYPNISKPYLHPADEDGGEWTQGSGSQWLTLKRPTNESWFNPWVSFLKEKYGVKFVMNTELSSIVAKTSISVFATNKMINSSLIDYAIVTNSRGDKTSIFADYYILAITPFAVRDIVERSDVKIKRDPQLSLFKGLTADGPHIQVSFRIGFKDYIKTPEKYMAFIFPDSEYNITCYFQNEIWKKDVYLGEDNRTLISGTACISYLPGKLFGKPIVDLTRDEFKQEILFQMSRCKNFNKIIYNSNGKKFNSYSINIFEIWKEWNFKGDPIVQPFNNTQSLRTALRNEMYHKTFHTKLNSGDAPLKWVNSTTTNQYTPKPRTSFANLILAGAHVKTSVDLYSMESAAESGRRAAFIIIRENPVKIKHTPLFTVDKPEWMQFLGGIDDGLYIMGLPNVVDTALIAVFSVLIYSLVSGSGRK